MANPVLGPRLRAAREAMQPPIAQKEMARRMGVAPSSAHQWEAGKTEPSTEIIVQLARLYGVSCDWLLGLDDEAPTTAIRANSAEVQVHLVPLVEVDKLQPWKWDRPSEMVQSMRRYPAGTAAAMVIETDALASACPVGSRVVFSKAQPTRNGSIVLADTGVGAPIVRRLIEEGGMGMLVADDTRYPTYNTRDGSRILAVATECVIHRTLA